MSVSDYQMGNSKRNPNVGRSVVTQQAGLNSSFGAMRNSSTQPQRPWMLGQRQQRQNYSMLPSKTYMTHNSGRLVDSDSVINKKIKQQRREQIEAKLLANSLPARILA